MSTDNTEPTGYLKNLPLEVIFIIFDYLSSNDIIYTFFYLNQQFKLLLSQDKLLIENKRYLNYLDLPTTHLVLWKNILSVIGSNIEYLNINTIDLSLPLSLFQNLKSLIISSPYGFEEKQLKSIVDSDQFNKLDSFEIKKNEIFFDGLFNNYLNDQDNILKKVFNKKNSLKTFQYPLTTPPIEVTDFEINVNLHSLTLMLVEFGDIFKLISYTPNLKYLNVQSLPPYREAKPIYDNNIE